MPISLQDQGIEKNDVGVRRVRENRGLSYDDGYVGIRQGIYDASEGSETIMEAEGDRRRV